MSQMNEWNKVPEKKIIKMQTSHLPEVEFQKLIGRMLCELRKRVKELSKSSNKDTENINKNHSEMKNTVN